jgi:hypothetical protein|tara:strand:- start:589 stop:711 length:123 start_codon:yes stop_codon:yes gene_type:complete
MLFADLGPPEHKPPFPTYDIFDDEIWPELTEQKHQRFPGD